MFEEDWIPSSDEDKKPMDLGVEDDDGAEALAYVLPNGRKSRAKKMKKRLWYDEKRAHPAEQFVKHLCFIDVYQFRNALQTMHIAQNRNYEYHRNCSDRVIAQCIDETCPFYVAASQIANEKTFTIRKQYVVHTCPSVSENTKVTAKWVAKFCEEAIRNDPCTTITTIINTAKSKYGVEISTHMAYRAKKAAKNVVLGDQKAQYTRIRDYLQQRMLSLAAYSPIIYPVPGPDMWPRTESLDIEAPVFKEHKGRAQTKRRKGQFEKPAPKDTSRMASITCSNCKKVGHRYTNCHDALKPALAMRKNKHQVTTLL